VLLVLYQPIRSAVSRPDDLTVGKIQAKTLVRIVLLLLSSSPPGPTNGSALNRPLPTG